MNRLGENYDSRESGLLMPFRALPGDHDHQGTLGPESIEFLDYTQSAGFTILHDLPLSPPDPFNSPYSSDSAFAIDPQRIDLFQLAEAGDINRFDLDRYQKLAQSGDAGPSIKDEKEALLKQAFLGFSESGSPERHDDFTRWCSEEAEWLDKFAAFEILKKLPENSDWRWQNWKIGKDYSVELITTIKTCRNEEFSAICYRQWVANEQTLNYLQEASQRGIEVWGDVPFYTGGGEVWANRAIFNLDADGYQINQGGAAPSMTSATGQRWGFATYKVDGLENPEQTAKVVDWYSRRLARASALSTGRNRLDHFVGQAEPWIIAHDAADGINGYRDIGLGDPLLQKQAEIYGSALPFYPEDLGTQTDKTPELRDRYHLLRNALAVRGLTKCLVLDVYPESPNNPDNYDGNVVAMTSNHDMLPLIGAMDSIRTERPEVFTRYISYINEGHSYQNLGAETESERIARFEMERVHRSLAKYAFTAIWDVLGLGVEGRYNVPDTISPNNWSWRMDSNHMSNLDSQALYWRNLNETSGRTRQNIETAFAAD